MKTQNRAQRAFSLVEVVVALAIVVFALFSMVGLLGVGLQNTQDARERVQAATVVEQICAIRRASPTNNLSASQPNFPLPAMNQSSAVNNLASPQYITRDGALTSQASADYGFLYSITPKPDTSGSTTGGGVSQVYICLFWPAHASPTSAVTGHYAISTTFGWQ
jgi:uncharacterized protein (TIGR02598 family)